MAIFMSGENFKSDLDKRGQQLLNYPPVSFFKSVHQPYYIYAYDFVQQSSGTRTLHHLCHALNSLGYEAYVNATTTNPYLRTPKLTIEVRQNHMQAGRLPIAVYPEVISGNPFNAPVVARWILNKRGHLGGDKEFAPRELLFYFDEMFLSGEENAMILTVNTIDRNVFNDIGVFPEEREGFCYYAHKYLRFGGKVSEVLIKNGTSLCQDIPRTPEEIANILRHSKALYSYEPSSMITEAEACGCTAIYIETDYLNQFNSSTSHNCVRIPESKIDGINHPDSIFDYKSFEEELNKGSWVSINNFIDKTQSSANNLNPNDFASFHSISEFLKESKTNYIYGAGKKGRECFGQLLMEGLTIDGFVVTDGFHKRDSLYGYPIYYLSEISNDDSGIIVAMGDDNRKEAIENLKAHGYRNTFISF